MKKLLSLILSTMLVLPSVVFADDVQKIKVGINAEFPPFEYYDQNGELYGFDIDLMNDVGENTFAPKDTYTTEQEDMLMFMTEIYDALGDECITFGKISTKRGA